MYLFFDTETTGLPIDWKASAEQVDNWPRIVQLAWALYDEKGELMAERCDLIFPDKWVIPTELEIKFGRTTEQCYEQGVDIGFALQMFAGAESRCTYRIAHNMNFDSKVMRAEIIRGGGLWNFSSKKLCTMMKSNKWVGARNENGGGKFPSLEELHGKCFGTKVEGAHDAGMDVKALANCFFKLCELGIIDKEQPDKKEDKKSLGLDNLGL